MAGNSFTALVSLFNRPTPTRGRLTPAFLFSFLRDFKWRCIPRAVYGPWSLYFKDGKPMYCYNFLGLQQFKVLAPQAVASGKATIRMNFDYDGGGLGKGGTATILVNGVKVASDRIERTQGMIFSADETADVGLDSATPVTSDYKEGDNSFTGKIFKVVVDVEPMGVAEKAEAENAQREARLKKAISD
jgi:hypothetical protein